jgi:hypothetical protein
MKIAARLAAGLVVLAFVAGTLGSAFAATPPHVVLDSQRPNTDACAICHRAHTATAVIPYRIGETTETTGTSLVLSTDPASGDVQLCFACHMNQVQLGSDKDIQSLYELPSQHVLAPATAPYGPSPIYCSSCHDSHGTARVASDVPYPRLLRSFEGTMPVYAGEAYCATCHTADAALAMGERFASLDVFLTTGHYSGLSTPTSGTGIRCSWCHEPHGSAVAPLLVASIVPTAVPTTFTVTADNRTFCIACHTSASATWDPVKYAASGHGSSTATVSITATWVPPGSRRVGECQVCHAPMGRDDGTGHAIPKLLDAKGRVLCDSCHALGKVAASTDTSSQAYPVSESARPELVAVYAPINSTTDYGRVLVYGRALPGADSRPLIGPKEYALALRTGPAAAGRVDPYLGGNQLVVASSLSAKVSVIASDALTGLRVPVTAAIPGGFKFGSIAVANVVPNGAGILPDTDEIIGVTGDGRLVVYDWTGSALSTSALSPVGGLVLPTGPWAIATGDLGGEYDSIVVTNRADGSITIASWDGFSITATTTPAGVGPVAPSIGRVWNDHQIVIGDAGLTTTSTVRVLDNTGAELEGYDVLPGTAKPTASGLGDVLPTVTGNEVALTFVNPTNGDSTLVVVPQAAPGPDLDLNVAGAVSRAIGFGYWTGSLLVGDVEGDAIAEVVVGSGGTSAQSSRVAPSVQVWRPSGADLAADPTYLGGGTELAGPAPSLVLADFGPVLPSRHPIDEGLGSHVSTETAPFTRHVTCSDCHNTHEGSADATAAPAVPGPLAGAWGVTVTYPGPTFGGPARSATGYGICYKCHSSYVSLDGRQDVAAQFDLTSVSRHAVVGASASVIPPATFVGTWNQNSMLYCTDCHGDSTGDTAAQKRELHKSGSSPILVGTLAGVPSIDPDLLCYDCHLDTVYAEGSADATSGRSYFQETDPNGRRLHAYHVNATSSGGHGISCGACHVSHGSIKPHLLREDIGFVPDAVQPHKGSCTNDCHGPAVAGFTDRRRGWPTQP